MDKIPLTLITLAQIIPLAHTKHDKRNTNKYYKPKQLATSG